MEVPAISEAVPVIEAAVVLHHDQAPFKLVVAEPSPHSRGDDDDTPSSNNKVTTRRYNGVLAAAKLVVFMLATAAAAAVLLCHQSSLFPTWSVDSVEYSLFDVHWWRLRSSATLSANVRRRR